MIPYFALLAVPAALAMSAGAANNRRLLLAVSLLFVFFAGFRYRVGMDWGNYDYIHTFVANYSFAEVIRHSEPLSRALFWLSEELGSHMLVTNIVAAALLTLGIFTLAQRSANPWLAVVAATPYLFIAFGMPAVRQAMAIGVVFFAFSRWHRDGLVARSALFLIAALFHTSAVLAFVLIFADLERGGRFKLAMAALVVAAIAYLIFFSNYFSEPLEFYKFAYFAEESIISPGALMHMSMVWVPAAVYLIFRRSLSRFIADKGLVLHGSVAAIALVPVYFISSTVGSRAILYLFFVPMLVYPALARAIVRASGRSEAKVRPEYDHGAPCYAQRRQPSFGNYVGGLSARSRVASLAYPSGQQITRNLATAPMADVGRSPLRRTLKRMRHSPAVSRRDAPASHASAERLVLLALVLAHFLVLGSWLAFANNSSAHLPYRNIAFEDR
jgi:hypothetical protein